MTDHFAEKSRDWDEQPVPVRISRAVGRLLETLDWDGSMRVMDFGAGTGLIAATVAPHVSRIVAVDTSPSMLEALAAKENLQGKVECRCQDIIESPLEERFDAIVSAMALHHVEDTGVAADRFADGVVVDRADALTHRLGLVGVEVDAVGNRVQAARMHAVRGEAAAAGESLLQVADLSRVWLELSVPESALPLLRRGQPVVARFDALPGVTVDGVYSIAHALDTALPGGLAGADDAEVKRGLARLLDDHGVVVAEVEAAAAITSAISAMDTS